MGKGNGHIINCSCSFCKPIKVFVKKEIRFCGCGCGESFECAIQSTKIFVWGHHVRLFNPMKRPEVVAKFMGENSPTKRLEVRKKISRAHKGITKLENPKLAASEQRKRRVSATMKGRKCTWGKKIGDSQRGRKKTEEQIRKWIASCNIKPNTKEKLLAKILLDLLPGEYSINVKGSVVIVGGRIPDFVNVNGQKKLIELFGDYWHSEAFLGIPEEEHVSERSSYFAKFGYKTLIIWERELCDITVLKDRILCFNKVKI